MKKNKNRRMMAKNFGGGGSYAGGECEVVNLF